MGAFAFGKLGALLKRFLPWAKAKRISDRRGRERRRGRYLQLQADKVNCASSSGRRALSAGADVEVAGVKAASSLPEALHGMPSDAREVQRGLRGALERLDDEEGGDLRELLNGSSDDDDDDDDDDEPVVDKDMDAESLKAALDARHSSMTPMEIKEEQILQNVAVKQIVHAKDSQEMFDLMDTLIQDEWMGSLNATPGDVYSVMALNWTFGKWGDEKFVRKIGCVFIFLIQLLGPPLIFYQLWTGNGIEDHEKIHWDQFKVGDLSDWEDIWGNGPTKLMAFLFLLLFLLNGVFCHMDESKAWLDIDRFMNFLSVNDPSPTGTCIGMMYLGAFVNTWVILWLSIDMFLIMGVAENVQAVLMDALALSFIYNLDDVDNDELGFLDDDDWPGLEITWMARNMTKASEDMTEVSTAEANVWCQSYMNLITNVLVLFTVVFSVMFVCTPFKAMKPDPFFQELFTAAHFVNATIAAMATGGNFSHRLLSEL